MSFTNVAANFHTFNNWNVGGRDFHLCKSVLTLRHATTASNGLETVRCCSSLYLGRHVRREGGGGTLYGWINVSQGLQWAPKLPLLTKRVRQKWLPSKSTMTLKVTQNWFFFLHVLLLNGHLGVCVCVWKRGRWHICNENRLRITSTWRKRQVRKR